MPLIQTKRIYDVADDTDGTRILVDKLWPRGISKQRAQLGFWAKAIAPSTELRKSYQHDSKDWPAFRKNYFAELDAKPGDLLELESYFNTAVVTFLYSSREEQLNNAVALKEYVEEHLL
jgi:uncharacterized protein YeaO (DUF488 family)